MLDFFSVETVAFTILGYPMSYIELVGTVLYLWSVWLISQKRMLTWPIGIVSVLLYLSLFYQIRLYSDALEQAYYLAASAYGWWYWSQSNSDEDNSGSFRYSPRQQQILAIGITLGISLALGGLMGQIHLWLPTLFPEPASFPYLDALTTVMSFTAMALMAQKRIESWLYWIVVDVIGIGLYFVKDVRFIALLYGVLLGIAIRGWWHWRKGSLALLS